MPRKDREFLVGYHRSWTLAERHRSQLERKLGVPVEIESRRSANGRYSKHGHTFTFSWEKPEDEYVDIIGIDSLYEE